MSQAQNFDAMTAVELNDWYEKHVGYRPSIDAPSMTADQLRTLCKSYEEEHLYLALQSSSAVPPPPADDDFADVLKELEEMDGACLYWQMPDPARAIAAVGRGKVKMADDLIVHPQATEIKQGYCYTMRGEQT